MVPLPAPTFRTIRTWAGIGLNMAFTDCKAVIETAQVGDVPRQAVPVQPANDEPADGVAVRVTVDPGVNEAEQDEPQSMPGVSLLTEPDPPPDRVTSSAWADIGSNVAVIDWGAVTDTEQAEDVPEQPPLQPAKVDPLDGTAVSATVVPVL